MSRKRKPIKKDGRSDGQSRNRVSKPSTMEDNKNIKSGEPELLAKGKYDNDPNWYFEDATLADQVSQLSFQQLGGLPIFYENRNFSVPNLVKIFLNPCPGVIRTQDYDNPDLNKTSGINLAGFRIFSMLSAYTGRIATYGPQDISTMILAMGEVISMMEWIRRCFGIANASSMRNRSYPREALRWGCMVDDSDFFVSYADYRNRFNTYVTLVNQLPIPKGIKYFDKCAALYEKVYLDAESSMAQSLITVPFTTWTLDEESDQRGTILKTTKWASNDQFTDPITTPRKMGDYLDILDGMIGALLNSSTLQVVYTDLLNLAVKQGQEFWKLDFIPDGYLVVPEYNEGVLLQMHNAAMTGAPSVQTSEIATPHVTPYNDVVPNPNSNTLYYNPAFGTLYLIANQHSRTGDSIIIDMLTSNPDVVSRVECTRYSSISGTVHFGDNKKMCDAVLPDHYVVAVALSHNAAVPVPGDLEFFNGSCIGTPDFPTAVAAASVIDWFPRIYEIDMSDYSYTGNVAGDLNFYTVVDQNYLRRLHQFMTLGLYNLRR